MGVAEKVVVRSLRELDVLVAERVMEIHPLVATAWANYSTAIADAWQVVECLRGDGWLVCVKQKPDEYPFIAGDWSEVKTKSAVEIHWLPVCGQPPENRRLWSFHDSAQIAICLAALKTKGIYVELELTDA